MDPIPFDPYLWRLNLSNTVEHFNGLRDFYTARRSEFCNLEKMPEFNRILCRDKRLDYLRKMYATNWTNFVRI